MVEGTAMSDVLVSIFLYTQINLVKIMCGCVAYRTSSCVQAVVCVFKYYISVRNDTLNLV